MKACFFWHPGAGGESDLIALRPFPVRGEQAKGAKELKGLGRE